MFLYNPVWPFLPPAVQEYCLFVSGIRFVDRYCELYWMMLVEGFNQGRK
jgi:hypothetical protein